jgi:hypothetical protein
MAKLAAKPSVVASLNLFLASREYRGGNQLLDDDEIAGLVQALAETGPSPLPRPMVPVPRRYPEPLKVV